MKIRWESLSVKQLEQLVYDGSSPKEEALALNRAAHTKQPKQTNNETIANFSYLTSDLSAMMNQLDQSRSTN